MKGPPLGPFGEDITWPDQAGPPGAEERLVPDKSNLKPQALIRGPDGPWL